MMKMKSLFEKRWSYCTLWGSGWDDPHEVADGVREMSTIRGHDLAGTVGSTTELLRRMRGERWCAASFTIAGGEAPAFEWLEVRNEACDDHRGKPMDGELVLCSRRRVDAREAGHDPAADI
jgi:hypothetical protein